MGESRIERLHEYAGLRQFGMSPERVRAVCTCGFATRPHLSTQEARAALVDDHGAALSGGPLIAGCAVCEETPNFQGECESCGTTVVGP